MRFVLAALAALAMPTPAQAATTLTFEGVENTAYGSPIIRNGFEISAGLPGQVFSEINSTLPGLVSNGTGVLLAHGGIFIRAVSGNQFSVGSFDAAPAPGFDPGSIIAAIGFEASGSSLGTAIFAPFSAFQTFDGRVLGNMSALFILSRKPDNGFGGYELDNVVLNEPPLPAPIPEPAVWAMFLVGFGLAGAALRSRPSLQRRGRGRIIPSGAWTS